VKEEALMMKEAAGLCLGNFGLTPFILPTIRGRPITTPRHTLYHRGVATTALANLPQLEPRTGHSGQTFQASSFRNGQ
jgi:hypothetical protein